VGHFSYTCKLSGLPITGNTPAVLIVMKMKDKLYDCSENHLRKYGSTSLVSNDSTQIKFQPVWFPIHCNYNDYGGAEDIRKDDNTELLEKYYGLSIEKIMDIVTSGRKDDGYDDSLKVIKKPFDLPDDYVEGEDWFNRYQRLMNDSSLSSPDVSGTYKPEWKEEGYEGWTVWRDGEKVKATKEEYDADFKLIHEHYARYKEWLETNPDPTDDYNKPQYEERYNELLTYSGMWVHGEVYDELTNEATGGYFDKLDLGTPEILEALGFEEIKGKSKDKRYDRRFKKGELIINSDGTWINVKNESIYDLPAFKEYCQKKGEDIDISVVGKKDRTEEIFDYVIPNAKSIGQDKTNIKYASKVMKAYEKLSKEEKKSEKGQALLNIVWSGMDLSSDKHPMSRTIRYLLLNNDEYRFYNPMTIPYFEAAKEGKIRDNMVRFWRFDHYMYCTGRYYDIVGTSPQDGEHSSVMKVLAVATKVLGKVLEERKEWEDE
jgi:hypothetical protein